MVSKATALSIIVVIGISGGLFAMYYEPSGPAHVSDKSSYYTEDLSLLVEFNESTSFQLTIPAFYTDNKVAASFQNITEEMITGNATISSVDLITSETTAYLQIIGNGTSINLTRSVSLPEIEGSQIAYEGRVLEVEFAKDGNGQIELEADLAAEINYSLETTTNLCSSSLGLSSQYQIISPGTTEVNLGKGTARCV